MALHRRARASLFYIAGYLLPTGIGLLVAPDFVFRLLFSNGTYGDVIPRMAGALLIALGALIVQIIRHQIDSLYPTAVAIRVFLIAVLAVLFLKTHDPFFLIVCAVVGAGVVWTAIAYTLDRRETAL